MIAEPAQDVVVKPAKEPKPRKPQKPLENRRYGVNAPRSSITSLRLSTIVNSIARTNARKLANVAGPSSSVKRHITSMVKRANPAAK